MRSGGSRVVGALGVVILAALACQIDRERPGPPRIAITLDADSIRSPDTLTGSLVVADPDGVDSIWLSVDSGASLARNALLAQTFRATFRAGIRSGYAAGARVPVRCLARDLAGFVAQLDTFIAVREP